METICGFYLDNKHHLMIKGSCAVCKITELEAAKEVIEQFKPKEEA